MRGVLFALLALLATGCLAVPPPGADDGADGDDGHSDDPEGQVDGGAEEVADGCVSGSALDLVWISEVAFDQTIQDQVSLRGLAIIVNPGIEPIHIGPTSIANQVGDGAVQAAVTLITGEMSLPPGEAMGLLSIGAALARTRFDEDWTNPQAPELAVVLHFDGSGVDSEIPLDLEIGGYRFDVALEVTHESFEPSFDWARDAERTTAFCP